MKFKARMNTTLIVNNISMPIDASVQEAFSVARKKLKACGLTPFSFEFSVYRRSVDARKKNDIKFVYSVAACGELPPVDTAHLGSLGISVAEYAPPKITFGDSKLNSNIVVVGSGPCGMFCALLLAENGFKPILLERGGSVEYRKKAVSDFERTRILDLNTNIQFGAGGAGTFSDGKLVTRINDPLTNYVLNTLVKYGAPREILYLARPHIGTDVLSVVISRILDRIVELGGKIYYHTSFIDTDTSSGRISKVITDKGEIDCSELVLAIGHSARDTYENLLRKNMNIEAKSFSVGMRIEHTADMIDRGLYGNFAGHPALGHAEYNLSYNTKERGVYTFCMCPGGVVVAAASEEGGVVSNGMSYHTRAGINSNSAVCCSIFKEDLGGSPIAAIDFQRRIERAAFIAGGKNYNAPIITVGDFINDKCTTEPTLIKPTYMNGDGVTLCSPDSYLPELVVKNLRKGILNFDKKIEGFASSSAVLTGAETRTSAPLRIIRSMDTLLATGFENLYPAGEGAGYAGGITSAAIDGLRVAMKIIEKYKP